MFSSLRPINKYGLTQDRVKHIKGVTLGVLCHKLFQTLTKQERITLILASQYHDVGYSTDLCIKPSNVNRHYIYGYIHLKNMRVSNQVCRLVLHHTYSRELERLKNNDLALFTKNPLLPLDGKLLFILNNADMTTNSTGETVPKIQRLRDITKRYGDSDVVTLHFKKALQLHSIEEKRYIPEGWYNITNQTIQEIVTELLPTNLTIKKHTIYHRQSKTITRHISFPTGNLSSLPDPFNQFTKPELIAFITICLGYLYKCNITPDK